MSYIGDGLIILVMVIVCNYGIAKHKRESFCSIAFAGGLFIVAGNLLGFAELHQMYDHMIISFMAGVWGVYASRVGRNRDAGIAIMLMAFFQAIMSLDGWLNPIYETIVYISYEPAIYALYGAIILASGYGGHRIRFADKRVDRILSALVACRFKAYKG